MKKLLSFALCFAASVASAQYRDQDARASTMYKEFQQAAADAAKAKADVQKNRAEEFKGHIETMDGIVRGARSAAGQKKLGVGFDDEKRVTALVKDSPAHKAGVKLADTILKLNEKDVKGMSHAELFNAIDQAANPLTLTVAGPAGNERTYTIEKQLAPITDEQREKLRKNAEDLSKELAAYKKAVGYPNIDSAKLTEDNYDKLGELLLSCVFLQKQVNLEYVEPEFQQ